jgi:uncharacterized protein (DUF1697 family)
VIAPTDERLLVATFIALLRGINVGGHRKVAMGKLCELCTEAGLGDVRSYVNSGNLVFTATGNAEALEKRIEAAIAEHYGFDVDVMVRSARDWFGYVRGNPFTELSEKFPAKVMLSVPKRKLGADAVDILRRKAVGEEQVERVGDVIWLYFADGAGRSKLAVAAPGPVPVTTRNWRTVLKLEEMAKSASASEGA